MSIKTVAVVAALLTASPVATLSASSALAQDVLKLAVGQRGNWDTAPPQLGADAGIFAKHGIKLDIVYTQGSGETLQAVISGSADVGLAGGLTGAMAAFQKGAPIRAISGSMTGADDLFWYVPSDSPVKTIKDMAGRTISYSTRGSSTHIAVLGFIKHFGVDMKPTPVGGPASSFAQTMSKQVDMGWSSAPLYLKEVRDGRIRIVVRESEVPKFQNMTVRINMSNLQTLQTKRALIDRFLKAYDETMDWMYSDDKALAAWAKFANVDVALAKGMRDEFFPKKNMALDRIEGLDDAMADAVEMKFLPAPLTKEQIAEFLKYYYKK